MSGFDFKRNKPSFEQTDKEPEKNPDANLHKKIDDTISKLGELTSGDKLRLIKEIEENPAPAEAMTVDIVDKPHKVSLRDLEHAQLADRPSTVNPMIVDQAVRAAIARDRVYKQERRFLGFNYWWIIILVIGLVAVLLFLPTILAMFGMG